MASRTHLLIRFKRKAAPSLLKGFLVGTTALLAVPQALSNSVFPEEFKNQVTVSGPASMPDPFPDNNVASDINLLEPGEGSIQMTKRAEVASAQVGDLVFWTLNGMSQLSANLMDTKIIDELPLGLSYVPGTATVSLNGQPAVPQEPLLDGKRLIWDDIDLDPNGSFEIRFATRVNTAAGLGELTNRGYATAPTGAYQRSAIASGVIVIEVEPTFDCPTVLGRVSRDLDYDGYVEDGEPGIAGARIITLQGLVIKTDKHGRYSIACPQIPDRNRGSNFALKLDPKSLPPGSEVSSENPRVIRLTPGKSSKANFAVIQPTEIKVRLDDEIFLPGQIKLKGSIRSSFENLFRYPKTKAYNLEIVVRTKGDVGLAQRRAKVVKAWFERTFVKQGFKKVKVKARVERLRFR